MANARAAKAARAAARAAAVQAAKASTQIEVNTDGDAIVSDQSFD